MPRPISNSMPVPPAEHALRGRAAARSSRSLSETTVDSRLKSACEEMESLFIHHMLSEMRKTVPKSGLADGGRAEDLYTSLMDAELAKQMAASGGMGLAKMLHEQMSAATALAQAKGTGR